MLFTTHEKIHFINWHFTNIVETVGNEPEGLYYGRVHFTMCASWFLIWLSRYDIVYPQLGQDIFSCQIPICMCCNFYGKDYLMFNISFSQKFVKCLTIQSLQYCLNMGSRFMFMSISYFCAKQNTFVTQVLTAQSFSLDNSQYICLTIIYGEICCNIFKGHIEIIYSDQWLSILCMNVWRVAGWRFHV